MLFKKRPPTPERRVRTPQQTARSGAVFSYHANRAVREGSLARDMRAQQPESNPVRRISRKMWLKRLPTLAILVAIVLLSILLLNLGSDAKVVTLGEDKNHIFLRDQSVYRGAAQKAFNSPLNSNKLTVNTSKIAQDLQKQFPELKAISISLPVVGNQPVVYIQPAAPEMILVSSQGMFLLDSNGRALITGNQVSKLNEIDTPVVTDQSNLPIKLGSIALPRDTVAFIREVRGQLKAKGIEVTSLGLPPGTNELHVRFQGAGYYVKFNLHGNARGEAGTFLAAKARLDSERKAPSEYVDVRVENKAFFR